MSRRFRCAGCDYCAPKAKERAFDRAGVAQVEMRVEADAYEGPPCNECGVDGCAGGRVGCPNCGAAFCYCDQE